MILSLSVKKAWELFLHSLLTKSNTIEGGTYTLRNKASVFKFKWQVNSVQLWQTTWKNIIDRWSGILFNSANKEDVLSLILFLLRNGIKIRDSAGYWKADTNQGIIETPSGIKYSKENLMK